MYDPDNNYALLAPGEVTVASSAQGQKIGLKMGRADSHTGNTTQGTKSYIDGVIIDWTNAAYPLIPAAGGVTPPPPPAPLKPAPPTNLQVQ
jgi:hypothetical protein